MDKPIYENYIEKYSNMVYRIALSYTRNICDAEDVFQNTFFELYKQEKEFESEEHLKNWLIRVCINHAKDVNKSFWKNKVVGEYEEDYKLSYKDDSFEKLHNAMNKIKLEYRVVLYLFYYEEYSTKEISKLLNVKEGNVRKRLERARKALAKYMEKED